MSLSVPSDFNVRHRRFTFDYFVSTVVNDQDMPNPDEFPLQLPDTKDGQLTVLSRLASWRTYRFGHVNRILLGSRYTFDYDRRLDEQSYDPVRAYNPDYPPCRPPPDHCAHFSWPKREAPAIFREGTCRYIQITTALSAGLNLNAQVYAGILGEPGDTSATPVAVKIYRPSQMKREAWEILEKDPPVFGNNIAVAMQSFKREYWAYTKMASLQGTVIPHVYGFFKLELKDRERCVVLVTELIENIDHGQYVSSVGPVNVAAIAALGNGLALAVHAVHTCGVSLFDFAARNIVVPQANPTFPVLIDFGDSCTVEETGLNIFPVEFYRVLSDVGFDRDAARAWEFAQETDQAWVEMFDITPASARKQ